MLRDEYDVHRGLWQLFSDSTDRRRDFLYRLGTGDAGPLVYVVSARRPNIPEVSPWQVETKEYLPVIRAGQRFAFTLRANPVVTRRNDEGRQQRHDVVMDAKRRLSEQGSPFRMADLIQERATAWLMPRGEKAGFELANGAVRADGYQQHRLHPGRGKRAVRFSTVDFEGVLTVADPHRFLAVLLDGIGPCKSFGCGLLLIRRLY